MNNPDEISVFKYTIKSNIDDLLNVKTYIEEELNRGLAFIKYNDGEETVKLSGRWQEWAEVQIIDNNKLNIYIKDRFFVTDHIIEQILTSLWSNLLDFGNIYLYDFQLSRKIDKIAKTRLKDFHTKNVGKEGPYFGTIYKPYYGLSLYEKVKIAKKFALAGGNFIKEDETYFVNKATILKEAKGIQSALNDVSAQCYYVPNITPYVLDPYLLYRLKEFGIYAGLLNYLIMGLPTIYKVRNKIEGMFLWGHRVGYNAINKSISMKAVGILSAYSGLDLLHVGTPTFSNQFTIKERMEIIKAIKTINPRIIPIFTKVSKAIIPPLLKQFGKNIIIMARGSIENKEGYDYSKIRDMIQEIKNFDI